jgi:transglutaminase/protease-like cytokinesis protein 3
MVAIEAPCHRFVVVRARLALIIAVASCAPVRTGPWIPPPPPSIAAPAPHGPPIEWPVSAAPEDIVVRIASDEHATIASVARYLAMRIPDQARLVKALHDYVILRVRYDDAVASRLDAASAALAKRGMWSFGDPGDRALDIPDQTPEVVLARGTAVCDGFAKLLVELGAAAGIHIEEVTGHVRGTAYPHAWNAAEIDGRWYLIDATWDLPTLPGDPDSISSMYLFSPPDRFVRTHLPQESKWQLLATPLTSDEFFAKIDDGPGRLQRDTEYLRRPTP